MNNLAQKLTQKLRLGGLFFTLTSAGSVVTAGPSADTGAIEEVIVTGSYIAGSAEDAALPVAVLSRDELDNIGNPSMIEMVRNLGVTSGNLGEANQFQTGPIEGVATVNLRGLGAQRTLVLLNGRRHVTTESLGVDISVIPSSALSRVEILKDGAAALYGSDAIGGVVNFITREDFEGLELRGSNQFIEDSDGDQNIAAIFGSAGENYHFMIAAEYEQRGELRVRDRSWALRPFAENPEGGWSGIGNPGRILPAFDLGAGPQPIGAGGPDPQCELLGGAVDGEACRFQYLFFNNLIEEQKNTKIFSQFNWDIDRDTALHIEGLYAFIEVPKVASSPTFPPQSLLGADRFIPATHPGLVDLKARHPELFPTALGVIPGAAQGAFAFTRLLGVAGRDGGPSFGARERDTSRIAGSLSGKLFQAAVDYELAVSWSQRKTKTTGEDSYIERTALALDGFGGPNCDPATGTPGAGGCEYYNPFSNAIEISAVTGAINPEYNPAIANSPELLEWLIAKSQTNRESSLAVVDAIFSGTTNIQLTGGSIGWAAGLQYRRERFEFRVPDLLDQAVSPCPFTNPVSITLGHVDTLDCAVPSGQLAFLAATDEESTNRSVYGIFGELALPLTDHIEVQAAIRFEDYGGRTGSTLDPKVAASWQITEWLKMRGSASTTFRGPPQSFLGGTDTSLGFIEPALAFKAVDIVGNPDLKAESAVATNLGFIVDAGSFQGSLDWWRFDFSDPFQTESATQILNAYIASGCEAGGAGEGSADCDILRTHVFPLATTAAGLERIEVNYINGADQVTSGLDLLLNYEIESLAGGDLSIGLESSYILEYESENFRDINGLTLSAGGDFVGLLNDGDPFTPKPDLKSNIFVKYTRNNHHITYLMRYVSDYKDVRPALPSLAKIDAHVTHDIHYNFDLLNKATLSLSVVNLTDEEPPRASLNLNYDPYTHNAFGRLIKLGIVYRLDQ